MSQCSHCQRNHWNWKLSPAWLGCLGPEPVAHLPAKPWDWACPLQQQQSVQAQVVEPPTVLPVEAQVVEPVLEAQLVELPTALAQLHWPHLPQAEPPPLQRQWQWQWQWQRHALQAQWEGACPLQQQQWPWQWDGHWALPGLAQWQWHWQWHWQWQLQHPLHAQWEACPLQQ